MENKLTAGISHRTVNVGFRDVIHFKYPEKTNKAFKFFGWWKCVITHEIINIFRDCSVSF